jgi:hypothetical protein
MWLSNIYSPSFCVCVCVFSYGQCHIPLSVWPTFGSMECVTCYVIHRDIHLQGLRSPLAVTLWFRESLRFSILFSVRNITHFPIHFNITFCLPILLQRTLSAPHTHTHTKNIHTSLFFCTNSGLLIFLGMFVVCAREHCIEASFNYSLWHCGSMRYMNIGSAIVVFVL